MVWFLSSSNLNLGEHLWICSGRIDRVLETWGIQVMGQWWSCGSLWRLHTSLHCIMLVSMDPWFVTNLRINTRIPVWQPSDSSQLCQQPLCLSLTRCSVKQSHGRHRRTGGGHEVTIWRRGGCPAPKGKQGAAALKKEAMAASSYLVIWHCSSSSGNMFRRRRAISCPLCFTSLPPPFPPPLCFPSPPQRPLNHWMYRCDKHRVSLWLTVPS